MKLFHKKRKKELENGIKKIDASKKEVLPMRFWKYGDLSEENKRKVYDRRHYHNLKGNEFKKFITKYLSPRLRELGFKGGGFNFYKQEGHLIETIQIFGDKYGGQGWIEVGFHIDFLPDSFFRPVDPKKIQTIDCIYRHSLHLSNGNQMIDYGTNEDEARFSIDLIYKLITDQGTPYLDLFKNFPSPFDQIELEDLKSNNPEFSKYQLRLDSVITTLNLARINVWLKNDERARLFSEYGIHQLEHDGPSDEWKSVFKRLMKGDTNFCFTEEEKQMVNLRQKKLRDDLDSI